MILTNVELGPFRSINTAQNCTIDPKVTVLVGMNEAGKTVFLQGIHKACDALDVERFEVIEDYPRKDLTRYNKTHNEKPDNAIRLTYMPEEEDLTLVNKKHNTDLKLGFTYSLTTNYKNTRTIFIQIDEKPIISKIINAGSFTSDTVQHIKEATSIRKLVEILDDLDLNDSEQKTHEQLSTRLKASNWNNITEYEVFKTLDARLPKTLYFSDYDILPGKLNIKDLARRYKQSATDPSQLTPKHKSILALLRMADVSIDELSDIDGYESLKAKIEGVSNSLTDQIMQFWKQNENIEVVVDIQNDSKDDAPFNDGANIYLRIKNSRHRVTTPFDKRSRGFIWFFSFLVWFDSVQYQFNAEDEDRKLILLLDEPALALHALAQSDFLTYIDHLSENHQVIYTTHSPFMVNSDRLNQVRMIEDKDKIGTVISENISGSDPRTVFPLQAALGWDIAQNLFISKRNFLVEGPSELIFLKHLSSVLEAKSRICLNESITIVPTGGLDKIVTFIALLGASNLNIAVLHDFDGKNNQKIDEMIKNKIISPKSIKNTSMYTEQKDKPSDIEDLLSTKLYIDYFNKTFEKQLPDKIKISDLPIGSRIIERLNRYLKEKNISLRPSGGFNHYLVASTFGSNPPKAIDEKTLSNFENLFKDINSILD
ncbi:AAA family ATPase [Pseudescherichia sp.]|uniref:AAA family ATPase n=1 Tax=Pseudescherichia sp. TaxID=2055881 RepID=UPI0028A9255D|nr:AAA family ATPase [Pseudescherichia sp.]